MKVLAKRFVVENERGNKRTGKTIEIRDSMTGRVFVLDQYPEWERRQSDSAGWAVSKQYGGFLNKFRTRKEALDYLAKLKDVM